MLLYFKAFAISETHIVVSLRLSFVNVLKLRGSIGTVGNQRIVDGSIYAGITPPGFADTYAVTNNTYNNGQGYGITFGSPQLRWETTKQYNFGLDFELFKNRIRGSVDYYKKKTVDLFLATPTMPSSGTLSLLKNSDATLTNTGVELQLVVIQLLY